MRKVNEENERIKRRYFQYAKEAGRKDQATIDKIAADLLRFEASTGFKSFKQFHIEHAVRFKRQLSESKNQRTARPLSKSTIDGILRSVKAFVHWLAGQSGYKSRISYSDADYFNSSAKDARVAHAQRDVPFPTVEQAAHAFRLMPDRLDIDGRNKAMFALLMLTGIRDGAMASLKLKHVDLVDGSNYQDAREVNTKNAKTFTSWFLPVDPMYRECFEEWVNLLIGEYHFGNDDPLFPQPKMGQSAEGSFTVIGLKREPYSSASKIREVVKDAFIEAGLPAFAPHSFRKTLVRFGDKICTDREEFKAWSLNLGHDSVVTTVGSYYPIPVSRQAELIKGLSAR